jgi:hypothetical protein
MAGDCALGHHRLAEIYELAPTEMLEKAKGGVGLSWTAYTTVEGVEGGESARLQPIAKRRRGGHILGAQQERCKMQGWRQAGRTPECP